MNKYLNMDIKLQLAVFLDGLDQLAQSDNATLTITEISNNGKTVFGYLSSHHRGTCPVRINLVRGADQFFEYYIVREGDVQLIEMNFRSSPLKFFYNSCRKTAREELQRLFTP